MHSLTHTSGTGASSIYPLLGAAAYGWKVEILESQFFSKTAMTNVYQTD
jgi:23S rRNA A1618 N6-methylase RlmF